MPGIMTSIGILQQDGELNPAVFEGFVSDVKINLESGSGVFYFANLLCSKKMSPSIRKDLLDQLEDEKIYEDFYKIWYNRYKNVAKALDVNGDFKVYQAYVTNLTTSKIPLSRADPTAVADALGVPLVPPFESLSAIATFMSIPGPANNPQHPPPLNVVYTMLPLFSAHSQNPKFKSAGPPPGPEQAASADMIANISQPRQNTKPSRYEPIPLSKEPGMVDLAIEENQIAIWIEASYNALLAQYMTPQTFALFDALLLQIVSGNIVGTPESPGLISILCKTLSASAPPIPDNDKRSEQNIYFQIFFQHVVKLFCLVYLGQCVGNGLFIKSLASTPLPPDAKEQNLPIPGLGITLKKEDVEQKKSPEFIQYPAGLIRGNIVRAVEQLLGPPDPTNPGIDSKSTPDRYKIFDPTYVAPYSKAENYDSTFDFSYQGFGGGTKTIKLADVENSSVTNAAKSELQKVIESAKPIYIDGALANPDYQTQEFNAQLAQSELNNLKSWISSKGKIEGLSVLKTNIPRVTNCGMLPPYIWRRLGADPSGKEKSEQVTYKDPRNPKSVHNLMGAGPLSSYWIGKGLEAQGIPAWCDTTPNSKNPEYRNRFNARRPRSGDIIILGKSPQLPENANQKAIEQQTTVLHVGILIDPDYGSPASPQGIGWLTADAGQGSFGEYEAVKYRLRPVIYVGHSILIAGEPNQTKEGENPWVQVLGWLDVDLAGGIIKNLKTV